MAQDDFERETATGWGAVETNGEWYPTGEYPCGGVMGVAVAWFVAGLFLGLLGLVLWIP